jgi:hypothetical protein
MFERAYRHGSQSSGFIETRNETGFLITLKLQFCEDSEEEMKLKIFKI